MTIEEIRNIIEEAEYGYIGIRADSKEYKKLKAGDENAFS